MHRDLLSLIIDFDWDDGNYFKSLHKHEVSAQEAEEIFINAPFIMNQDAGHSAREQRYQALGKTNEERKLFVAFTLRNSKVRVISARPMNKYERGVYEKEEA